MLYHKSIEESVEYLTEFNSSLFQSPVELLNWMKKNVKYHLENEEYNAGKEPPIKTAEEVFKTKKGHCAEQSYLEKKVLDDLGYKTQLIFVKENNSKKDYGADGNAHVFLVYEDKNKFYWFEHSMEHMRGIHEFNSLEELLKSVAKNWWRYDSKSDILEVRFLDRVITGIDLWELAKECHKRPLKYTFDISKNRMEKDKKINETTEYLDESEYYLNTLLDEAIEKHQSLKESELLDERLEVLVSRPKDFFKKELHLYRADRSSKNFDGVVRRTYLNGGTNLSSPRASSFWSDARTICIFYGLRHTLKNIFDIEYPEINNASQVFHNQLGLLTVYVRRENDKKKILAKIKNIKIDDPFYIHEITVKGSDPDLGIGHNPSIREFTLDRDIVPDKSIMIDKWPEEYINSITWVTDPDEYLSLKDKQDKSKITVGTMERLVKHYYDGTWRTDNMNPKNLMKTDFFKNEFIDYVNNDGRAIQIISDVHIGKNKTEYKDILNDATHFGKVIQDLINKTNPRYIVFLGDIVDKSNIDNFEEIFKTMMAAIDKYSSQKVKILYILGNSEHNEKPMSIMFKAFQKKKNLAWAGYIIKTDKYVFTHAPIDSGDRICIHGHLHNSDKYFNTDPSKCVNVSKIKGMGYFVSIDDVIKNINKNTGVVLDKDPTGGKKNKVMTKLYREYDKGLKESANNDHSNNTVLDKARDIMEKMNNIQYGSVYANGKISKRDNNDWYDDSNKFCPQPVLSTLKTKTGHCIDQSELERYYFKKANIKHKVFSMFPERGSNMYHNHAFLVFFDENDTPYWFDHAWYSERGIHKGESLEDLFKKICDKKRKAYPKNDPENAEKFKNIKYEIFEVPAKACLCWDDYIDWVWKQKLVYKG